ncbi:MAG: hybrid-cluster NAD(P)-dependent oxidoreductase [Alphaproteobacteria bacterium]|nr:hybrid-cluster NAD(P)-dependent oxidoreductase [Alphaproteobacteria bacterium]
MDAAAKFWNDSEELECVTRTPEAPNVVTFSFQSPSGALFNHLPGQFVTLELPLPSGTIYRTYTISSSPSRPTALTVTVKAQGGSLGTRWMLDHLHKGMRIRARGPAGKFSTAHYPAKKHLFISAGSGITPMVAMTTWMYDSGREPDIIFINCAQRPSDIVLRGPMEFMATRIVGLDIKWVVEEADPFRPWTGYKGRFNQIMLGLMAPDYLEREVFCCGPEPFMRSVREALEGLGFDMGHYHQESFQAEPEQADDTPADVFPDHKNISEITFSRSGKSVRCSEGDTVLAVAKSAGFVIPSGCSMGICGTCKVHKTDGNVHMVHNGGITDEDIAEGYILACCSKPLGNVTVDF